MHFFSIATLAASLRGITMRAAHARGEARA
jgi:hypothetical protein